MWYYSKRLFQKYALDLDEGILECGSCSLISALKATILMRGQNVWIKLIEQYEKFPVGVCGSMSFTQAFSSRTTHEQIS